MFRQEQQNCPSHISVRSEMLFEFTDKTKLWLRTHFGYGRNQIRRGTAKEQNADCNGATSRVKPEKIMVGASIFVQKSRGKRLRIPAKTKNIPVSNSTDIKCASMSPVATGKLSKLSSCINGENTAISTIRMSTIFGILRCIILCRGAHGKRRSPDFGDCGDYSTMVINCNHLTAIDLKIRAVNDAENASKYMILISLYRFRT